MGTDPAMIRATNELLRIANHAGLNSEESAHVSTDAAKGKLVSIVSGINVEQMRVAVLKFFEGRVPVTANIDSTGRFLVVVQPYRE